MTAPATGHDPTAVLGRRSIAYVIDTLIVSAIAAGTFFATADVTEIVDARRCGELDLGGTSRSCAEANDTVYLFENRAILFAALAALAWILLVGWVLQGATGATVGKLIAGVRTVDEQGRGPGLGKQAIRGLLWVVPDGLLTCFGIPVVAAATAGFTKGHRRVGDMAAKTFVVRSRDRGAPIVVPGVNAPPGGFAPPAPSAGPYGEAPPVGAGATFAATPPAATPPATTPPAATWAAPGDQPTTLVPPPPAATAAPPTDTWAPPVAEPEPTPEPVPEPVPEPERVPEPEPAAEAPVAAAPQPQWDEARQTYLLWDPDRQIWLAHDRAADQWRPLQ